MKYILPGTMLLFSLAVLATGGGPQSYGHSKSKDTMNGQRELEERNNNASVIMGTGTGRETDYDGKGVSEKDTRPQGGKHNSDYSDTNLKSNDE